MGAHNGGLSLYYALKLVKIVCSVEIIGNVDKK